MNSQSTSIYIYIYIEREREKREREREREREERESLISIFTGFGVDDCPKAHTCLVFGQQQGDWTLTVGDQEYKVHKAGVPNWACHDEMGTLGREPKP